MKLVTTTRRLVQIIDYQTIKIQVAEEFIDRMGKLPDYRRKVLARIEQNIRNGEEYPEDLVAGAREGAECQGPPRRGDGSKTISIEEYIQDTCKRKLLLC